MRILARYFALTLALSAFLSLQGQEPTKEDAQPYLEKQTGLKFPPQIDRLKFDSSKEFGDPRLGVGLRYRSPESLHIDAIIYNQGLKTIAADPSNPQVKEEADRALRDIQTAADRGLYKDLKVAGREVVPLSKVKGAPTAHKLLLSFTLTEVPRESCLYLFAYKNHFVKVRATWLPDSKEASEKDVAALLAWFAAELK